ncbi:FAD-binding protein [Nonomuraea bangladeshensis]|uniref:FAD-binding protein n=1 Tax=Nonomuraea bangladeshensis TaxID=404385 RepID=UPI0031CF8779
MNGRGRHGDDSDGAGASASIEAARAGAEVLVLDAAGGWGGASAMAGGSLYMGGGTPLQKACGVEDSPEAMHALLRVATGPDPAKVHSCRRGGIVGQAAIRRRAGEYVDIQTPEGMQRAGLDDYVLHDGAGE